MVERGQVAAQHIPEDPGVSLDARRTLAWVWDTPKAKWVLCTWVTSCDEVRHDDDGNAHWHDASGTGWYEDDSVYRLVLVLDPYDRGTLWSLLTRYEQDADPGIEDVDYLQWALLRLLDDPRSYEVHEHYVVHEDPDSQTKESLCGKVWRPNPQVAYTSAGRCPDCMREVEERWAT